MAGLQTVKRLMLLLGALIFCVGGFLGLVLSGGEILWSKENFTVFTLTDKETMLTLPCKVPGTELIAKQLMMYEGPFLEGGTDVPVSDITALLLYNSGQQEIAQAEVILQAQQELTFFASNIMPGAQVLVLERNAASWQNWQIAACTGWTNQSQRSSLPEGALQIRDVDMGTIAVTNTTDQTLTDVWLYYKNYLPQSEIYIGGITYLKTIVSLAPGQTMKLPLNNYASGYSRILKAEMIP